MRRHDKKQNIRKANLLFEQRCNESKEVIKEEVAFKDNELSEQKTSDGYFDPGTGQNYTTKQVEDWINYYQTGYRIPTKERKRYEAFFKRIGLTLKDYAKPKKPKTVLNLKRYGDGYYAEGVIDGYTVRIEVSPGVNRGDWSWEWRVNGVRIDESGNSCNNCLKSIKAGLDKDAQYAIEEYKNLQTYN